MRYTVQALVAILCLACCAAAGAADSKEAFTDPKEAGPDFAAQGEYEGEIKTDNAKLLPAVTDFYMTNPIARASGIMAECSQMQLGLKLLF